MPIVINPASEYAKELRRWEQHHTKYSADELGNSTPGNPYVFRKYPQMLYKAFTRDNGKVMCGDNPLAYRDDQAQLAAESFSRSCQRLVATDQEYARARDDGWRDSPADAIALHEAYQQDMARAAAETQFAVQRMSAQARAEHRTADQATHQHVTDVVGVSKARRGRKPKAQGVVATAEE